MVTDQKEVDEVIEPDGSSNELDMNLSKRDELERSNSANEEDSEFALATGGGNDSDIAEGIDKDKGNNNYYINYE